MRAITSPRFNLEGFGTLTFHYGADDDIAVIHLDGPKPAVTWEVDDSWYLRVADDEIVGMELHGLRRIFLSTKLYAALFRDALAELIQRGGSGDLSEGLDVTGSVDELPKTAHLVIFLMGRASEKFDAALREEYADAGRALLGEAAST
jgi:hypothetical protein